MYIPVYRSADGEETSPIMEGSIGGIRRYTKSSSIGECALLSNYISSRIINKLLLEAQMMCTRVIIPL